MKNEEIILQVKNLKKSFGKVQAVKDVTLEVKRGEIFGFLGPNGAGKTTTIGMILGLLHADQGKIVILGKEVTPAHNQILHRVGTLIGQPSLILSGSARYNLEVIASLYPDTPASRIDEVLKLVSLHEVGKRPARTFSTGMKQRLGLALALYNKPDLLILDEPTNGMDAAGMHEVRLLLRHLASEGTTIFVSSHLLHEMEQLCHRVAVIQHGQIIAQGQVASLLAGSDRVQIKTTHMEKTITALSKLTSLDKISTSDNIIEVDGLHPEEIIEFLVGQSLTPREVAIKQVNLESLFLKLTAESTTAA